MEKDLHLNYKEQSNQMPKKQSKLYKNKIYPSWDIRNVNHGNPSDQDRITPHIIEPKKQNANLGETVNLLDIERYQYTDFSEASFYFNHYFALED